MKRGIASGSAAKTPLVIYERNEGIPVECATVDGTEALLGEDTLDTDWDLSDGVIPPPGFWRGTHNRDGTRVPGFTEEEYQVGDRW